MLKTSFENYVFLLNVQITLLLCWLSGPVNFLLPCCVRPLVISLDHRNINQRDETISETVVSTALQRNAAGGGPSDAICGPCAMPPASGEKEDVPLECTKVL